jgi:DNA-binding GntR family transcriptional regulator
MIERKQPAYVLIKRALQTGISDGRLPAGAVLSEGVLASIFGASRSPVRQAFAELEREGVVRRFDGRGVVVSGADIPPIRMEITPSMLGLDSDPSEVVRGDAWETVYYDLERSIIHRSVFGRVRVNELALARHYGVGRTVARNLLVRAQTAGILTKGDKAHWYIVPLSATRIRDLYELRIALEPLLIKTAAASIPPKRLSAMEARLHEISRLFPSVTVTQLDELEDDLHVQCLGYSRNKEMIEALKRTHCTLVIGKHIQAALAKHPQIDPFMDEHLAVIQALKDRDGEAAAAALVSHLTMTQKKATERLEAFRALNTVPSIPFIAAS